MHFRFALDSSYVDLWDIDLLDTDLDLWGTDIQCLSPIHLEDVFKTCLQDVFKTSLQDVFNVTIFRLPRRL